MIIGIGTDIVRVGRFLPLLEKYGERFPRRLLSTQERLEYSRLVSGHAAFLAKRFAAKEAVAKAMGKGIGAQASFIDIEVTHDASGRPTINFSEHAAAYVRALGASECHISIADEKDYAVAFAVLS